jgi:two-component system CheB/CheR fusion protein
MFTKQRSAWLRYGAAVLAVGLATAVRMTLDPLLGDRVPFVAYGVATLVAAAYGRWGPALVALLSGVFLANWFFIFPRHELRIVTPGHWTEPIAYLFIGGLMIGMCEALKASQRTVEAANCALVRQLDEHKRTEDALRESEELYRTLVNTLPAGIILADPTGAFTYISPAAQRILGLAPGEGLGKGLGQWVAPECEELRVERGKRLFTEKHPQPPVEYRLLRTDGTPFWAELTSAPFFDLHGGLKGIVTVCQDISDHKRMENDLRQINQTLEHRVAERTAEVEDYAANLRALAAELTQAAARERRHLAQILHDHLQQLLVAAKFRVELACRKVQEPSAAAALRETCEFLDQALTESRSLTVELSPPLLYEDGLAAALRWLAGQFQDRHHLPVSFQADARAEPSDEPTRVLLFQCVRELLFNCVKHARARSVQVCLDRFDEDRLRLVVSDDGCGFAPEAIGAGRTTDGFGLFSIRERLQSIGGRLEIVSSPGQGTQMVIETPSG